MSGKRQIAGDDSALMAEAIVQASPAFRAGTVLLWGYPPVRPDDDEYKIVMAVAGANRLDLTFEHHGRSAGKKAQVLTVHHPRGLRLGGKMVMITSATRIVWGEVEVVLRGDMVELRGVGETEHRSRAGAPALEFRAAIGT